MQAAPHHPHLPGPCLSLAPTPARPRPCPPLPNPRPPPRAQFKQNMLNSSSVVQHTARCAMLPGSRTVLNRTSGKLEPCTPTLCPYATLGADPSKGLINRAPYIAVGSISAGIRSSANIIAQQTAFETFAAWCSTNVSWTLVTIPETEFCPFRLEHFDPNNLHVWARAGYPEDLTSQWLNIMLSVIQHPNVVVEVQTLGAWVYRQYLEFAGAAAGGGQVPIPVIMAGMQQQVWCGVWGVELIAKMGGGQLPIPPFFPGMFLLIARCGQRGTRRFSVCL